MSQKIFTLSQSPYFDDYDPDNDYTRVLFRPSYPVQARELTTLQSTIQDQISRLGDSLYKDGARVSGGGLSISSDATRMYLTGTGNASFPPGNALSTAVISEIGNMIGLTVSNETGTVKARVIQQPASVTQTLQVGSVYIKYLTTETFDSDGGFIYAFVSDNAALTNNLYNTYGYTSDCCLASVADGSYYIKGIFAHCAEQTVALSTSTKTPTLNIGFTVAETIVTADDDASLFDNARGTTNEGSPGAHRLKLDLTLATRLTTLPADSTFYRIATMIDGALVEQTQSGDELSGTIVDTMARRTYDESGHYALKPFTQTVGRADSDSAFRLKIGPSKAYVKGYEITKLAPVSIDIPNGLSEKTTTNYKIPFVGTTSVQITGQTGTLPGQNAGDPYSTNYLLLKDSGNFTIGFARGYSVAQEINNGVIVDKLYFYDIQMFTDVTLNTTGLGALAVGNQVYSGKVHAQVESASGSSLTLSNVSGKIRIGSLFESLHSTGTGSVLTVTSHTTDEITAVAATDGSFICNTVANTFANSNSELISTLDKTLKTLTNGFTIDNDFTVYEDTSVASGTANGTWNPVRVDDNTGIKKTLKYKYIRVLNTSHTSSGINYGWSALDREISLHYPDIQRVYQVNLCSDNTFTTGRFARVGITTAGVLPQGAIITGVTSGSKAVVALSNQTSGVAGTLASVTYHPFQTGTNSTASIEVIYTTGSVFTEGEYLTVQVPNGQETYTYEVIVTDNTAEVGKNVTNMFLLDDGQRGEYYDVGRLVRKADVPSPTNDLVVFFSYWEIDDIGNYYYTVDSYKEADFWTVDPRFYGESREIIPKNKDSGRDLRNSIDFRLRVKPNTTSTSSPFAFKTRSFEKQGRIVPQSVYTTDVIEYLGRMDMLVLTTAGDFEIVSGIPGTKLTRPKQQEDSMTLSYITIPPAVRYPEDEVYVEMQDNRRYTMRDIGALDQRISNVESAVALNRMELQALLDNVDGRTKSGFVTDDFATDFESVSSSADRSHSEFNSSVDVVTKQLVPAQTSGVPVPMTQSSSSNVSNFFDGFLLNAFTEVELISQMRATSTFKINPFAVWAFKGEMKMNPSEDNWRVRKDDYFTNYYGELKPFEGSAADFQNFSQINTSSPGGRSTTQVEWVGRETRNTFGGHSAPAAVKARVFELGRQFGGRIWYQETATTTTQARRSTTTTVFDTPRAQGRPTETLTGSTVIENPQDYFMRSVTVTYDIKGLRPLTSHASYFGDKLIASGLVSDNDGELSGTFTIPAHTFKAGSETFKVIDEASKGGNSSATGIFRSIGHLDTYNVIQNTVSQTTNSTLETGVIKKVDFSDPIAQLFMLPVDTSTGNPVRDTVILTSVDLWFGHVDTRPSMNKVVVEIRESVNGYPGGPHSVIGTTGLSTISSSNQVTTITTATASNFKFKEPVILSGGKEYAIVIKSPSDSTTVYVAEMGQQLIDNSGIHSSQPLVGGYSGSFFKSQNSSTWEADQNRDLTFKLKRAQFNSALEGTVTYMNTLSNTGCFNGDVGAYNQGLAVETFTGSNYVRIHHPNHGMHFFQAKVTLSGLGSSALNGIPVSELETTHDVVYPTLDTYMVKTTSYATSSGRVSVPVFTAFATQCVAYDSLMTNLMVRKQENDLVFVDVKTSNTNSFRLSVENNKIVNPDITSVSSNALLSIPYDTIVEFETPQIVRNLLNASSTNDLQYTVYLKSANDASSPILRNGSNVNPIVFRNVVGECLIDSDLEGLTTTTISNTDVDDTQQEYVSYIQGIRSELEHSAYITKQIDLEIPADGFTIFFTADMEPGSKVDLSYKIRPIGSTTPFEEIEWVDFPYDQQVNEINFGSFSSIADPTPYTVRVSTSHEFTSFKIRVRMIAQNEAQIPHIGELRVVADI